MKFSEQWLFEVLNTKLNTQELTDKLTFAGLELESIEELKHLKDKAIDVAITPNRGDCLSIQGIAREVALLFDLPFKADKHKTIKVKQSHKFSIKVKESKDCPRYIGRVIKNIDNNAKTPKWMQDRLEVSGINLINPVVDVTNYVMLELGQPMHGFDLAKIDSEIVVRKSNNEAIKLLDESEVKLDKETLVIADKSKVLAIAGIMGGIDSGVRADTTDILLESAYFNPDIVRPKVQQYGIHTDSSYRFERKVDFNLQEQAIERATELLLDIVGGEPGELISVVSNKDLPKLKSVNLRKNRLISVLGLEKIADSTVTNIFKKLGFECKKSTTGWTIIPPSFRADIEIEEDLIEEVARTFGYSEIPTKMPNTALSFKQHSEAKVSNMGIKKLLTARGYSEAITYSFIAPELAEQFSGNKELIKLKNPIAFDMSVMRPSLIPGLLQALAHNQSRQEHNVRLFEHGLKFYKSDNKTIQEPCIAGVACGSKFKEHWDIKAAKLDFFDVKGDLETIFGKTHISSEISFAPATFAYLHSGQTATISKKGKQIGLIGAVHPHMLQKMGITGPVFAFEIDYKALTETRLPKFTPLSKYPSVRRDLALLVDDNILVSDITNLVYAVDKSLIQDVLVFDVYQGKGVENGKKSIALGVVLQDLNNTLTDEKVNQKIAVIIDSLKEKLKISLRE